MTGLTIFCNYAMSQNILREAPDKYSQGGQGLATNNNHKERGQEICRSSQIRFYPCWRLSSWSVEKLLQRHL